MEFLFKSSHSVASNRLVEELKWIWQILKTENVSPQVLESWTLLPLNFHIKSHVLNNSPSFLFIPAHFLLETVCWTVN